jgi:hypothetical protein
VAVGGLNQGTIRDGAGFELSVALQRIRAAAQRIAIGELQ